MASYGDLAAIKRMLAATGATYDANTSARLNELNESISLIVEYELGRRFGESPPTEPETRLVYARGGTMLILPTPMWSVTSVAVDGTVTGDAMADAVALDASTWQIGIENPGGEISGLMLYGGYGAWLTGQAVNVTGYWAEIDQDTAIPVPIVSATNKLVVDHYKRENVPIVTEDGIVVPARDPWLDPFWLKVKQMYQIGARELVM